MKLWDKGIKIDQLIEQFTVGNDREIDIHIAKYDVQASVAHAKMLASIGIITSEELAALQNISIVGFMGMATNTTNEEQVANEFQELKNKVARIQEDLGLN